MIMYLAHPVAPTPEEVTAHIRHLDRESPASGETIGDMEIRAARAVVRRNVDRALDWLRWLVIHTDWIVSAPWIPYALSLDDTNPADRSRGMHDSRAMAAVAGGIVLVGGRLSTGMDSDRAGVINRRTPGPVVDLIDLGVRPPTDPEQGFRESWATELRRRFSAAQILARR